MRGGCRVDEAGGSVAAQVGNENAIAGVRQGWYSPIPCPHIVGEAVKQYDREAIRSAALFVSDIEHRSPHAPRVLARPHLSDGQGPRGDCL